MKYYIYIIRCSDNSLYTGITSDLNKRINQHFTKDKKCAKYTKSHNVVKLECVYICETKSLAAKLEYYLKTLKKFQKEEIICGKPLNKFFKEKIDCEKYKKLDISSIK